MRRPAIEASRTTAPVAIVALGLAALVSEGKGADAEVKAFAADAIGGTLARDHQSRAIYFDGEHRRTYVAYMDDDFFARITYYDHEQEKWRRFAELVDHCIGPNGRKDGHNVPNLYVTDDGTVHLLYGSHGHRFKYVRSVRPEDIEDWTPVRRVGKSATYPYFRETTGGRLLLFYRYGPKGGYNHPYLGLQISDDNGESWSEIKKLATFPTGCKISRAAYDATDNQVHLLLNVPSGRPWKTYHCIYDVGSGEVRALNGEVLGPLAEKEDFLKAGGLIAHGGGDSTAVTVHEGRAYFLFRDKEDGWCFGYWNGDGLVKRPADAGTFEGMAGTPNIRTTDGRRFHAYAIVERKGRTEVSPLVKLNGATYRKSHFHGMDVLYKAPDAGTPRGGDVMVWTTEDRGKSWDGGEYLLEREEVGHPLDQINLVMGYAGDGPFLITNEPTGRWPKNLRPTGGWSGREKDPALYRQVHYDNPAREWKRLYGVSKKGRLLTAQ